jgi:hypothetical protein
MAVGRGVRSGSNQGQGEPAPSTHRCSSPRASLGFTNSWDTYFAGRHGCHPLRGRAMYGDVYKLTYVRGPSGILVMLAGELNTS